MRPPGFSFFTSTSGSLAAAAGGEGGGQLGSANVQQHQPTAQRRRRQRSWRQRWRRQQPQRQWELGRRGRCSHRLHASAAPPVPPTCTHVDGVKGLLPLQRITQHVASPQLHAWQARGSARQVERRQRHRLSPHKAGPATPQRLARLAAAAYSTSHLHHAPIQQLGVVPPHVDDGLRPGSRHGGIGCWPPTQEAAQAPTVHMAPMHQCLLPLQEAPAPVAVAGARPCAPAAPARGASRCRSPCLPGNSAGGKSRCSEVGTGRPAAGLIN